MKFGKRLASEASRRWVNEWIRYKSLKRSIKEDLRNHDGNASSYRAALLRELARVSAFYCQKEVELADALAALSSQSPAAVTALLVEIQELQKFVALNYLAVIKATKKCNRRLKELLGDDTPAVQHHLEFLSHEAFFTSPRLAQISTQAEILAKEVGGGGATSAVLEDYQCPICLDVLHSPVVLTCAHRFCWGCLLGHCSTFFQRIAEISQTPSGVPSDEAGTQQSKELAKPSLQEQQEHGVAKAEEQHFYNCPVCRKPQVLDVDILHTDVHLSDFIEGLKKRQQGITALAEPAAEQAVAPAPAPVSTAAAPEPAFLLPARDPRHQDGRMTVLLDLDGTLVSSFSPKRAPALPPSVRTHYVGHGSQLNPQGVFVVERPGLQEFLEELSQFSEVVIFTAGLEDYARPIIQALDPEGRIFAACIFREGTVKSSYYQCVKDMAFVGRPLERTLLVDDTALAFLHQPNNGVPVQGFRGDADDKLLLNALLPLLKDLSSASDVRTVLEQRFNMASWFSRHGYPIERILEECQAKPVLPKRPAVQVSVDCKGPAATPVPNPEACHASAAPEGGAPAVQAAPEVATSYEISAAEAMHLNRNSKGRTLFVFDFDSTLTDCDATERLFETLAPELVPMLRMLEMPANYVPTINSLLAELQRRGVSRDKLLQALRDQAQELPAAVPRMLRHIAKCGAEAKILSDCNTVFISQVLTGAKVNGLVSEVITNPATFERVVVPGENQPSFISAWGNSKAARSSKPPPHKLVISYCQPKGCKCPRCPENLCKGAEVAKLVASGKYSKVVYAGDGANDICPALTLGPSDVVLARRDYSLGNFFEGGQTPARAKVQLWQDHEELLQLVRGLVV